MAKEGEEKDQGGVDEVIDQGGAAPYDEVVPLLLILVQKRFDLIYHAGFTLL